MKIEIKGNTVRITGNNDKGILISHSDNCDRFIMEIFQDGIIHGCLPMVEFCKNHTVITNNRPIGKSFVD